MVVVVDSKRCGSLSGGERDIYGKGISDDGYLYIRYEAIEEVDFCRRGMQIVRCTKIYSVCGKC